jgi:heterodisulfide reductase subunit A-like polyferredoxin
MEILNDNYCSWLKDLEPRKNIKILKTNNQTDWLIIGAGYTGLSAARKLAEIYPNKTITLISATISLLQTLDQALFETN